MEEYFEEIAAVAGEIDGAVKGKVNFIVFAKAA